MHTIVANSIAGEASDQVFNPDALSDTISLSTTNLLQANNMALNNAIGKITPINVGNNSMLK